MSNLFAILYPEPNLADAAMEALEGLSHAGKIKLADACAVVKDENGHVHLHQESNFPLIGALGGLAIGTLLGWFVLLPYLGIPGALIGALVGKFKGHGLDDGEMKGFSKEMDVNSSALFILMSGPEIEIVLKGLAPFGGRIFHTSLSKYQENELEEKLEKLRNLFLEEAEHPAEFPKESPPLESREELVIEVKTQSKSPGKRYRLVWFYNQWPQGNEYQVLANGLTQEEAEMLREKKDPHLKSESFLIEEEKDNINPDL
jgi:uncharacterized membrane protein